MLWDLSGTVRDRGHSQLCYDRMASLECWDLLGQKYAEGLPLSPDRIAIPSSHTQNSASDMFSVKKRDGNNPGKP